MTLFTRAALAAFMLLFCCAQSFAHPIATRHAHTVSAHTTVTVHNRAPQGHAHVVSSRH